VRLISEGGTFLAPVKINGTIELKFTIDSGAADVSIPYDVFSTLIRTGTIGEGDLIGTQKYANADGEVHRAVTFRIRSLTIGGLEVHDVIGSVANSQAPMLLGQSFLRRFRSWSIDNATGELVLQYGNGDQKTASRQSKPAPKAGARH